MSTAPEAIDPNQIRQITLEILGTAAKIAAWTPTPIDDQVIAAATKVVNNDLAWGILVKFLQHSSTPSADEFSNAIMASVDDSTPQALDIAALIALFTTLWPLIQQAVAWFRNRKDEPSPTPSPSPVV